MRLEYIIVGFVLAMVVLLVAISMLTGVIPGVDAVFNLFKSRV